MQYRLSCGLADARYAQFYDAARLDDADRQRVRQTPALLHGTGTPHNDSMESLAIAQVFGNHTPCTSTKPSTGHTLGAAGAIEAAFLWGIISRQDNPTGKLPPQLNSSPRDSRLPPIGLTNQHSHWQHQRRIGASSSFAFGGSNAVLIIGESVKAG